MNYVTKINSFKPDILFVAYGMKKQEDWIKNNRNKANFGVAIGVGRSFDYYRELLSLYRYYYAFYL